MTFKELVKGQKLNEVEFSFCEHLSKRWDRFSNALGTMNKSQTLKVLKYLVENRPHSKTLGERAVRRFNMLNKVRWEDLKDGD